MLVGAKLHDDYMYEWMRRVSQLRTPAEGHVEGNSAVVKFCLLDSLVTWESVSVPVQIYTDWANHYLAKSGHKRLIKDLQQDVTDGVLLAQIIQVVANDKIEDINGCPKNRSQM
ncbi:hypothetical protein STEG23_021724, partial [Scotinomys teguina]